LAVFELGRAFLPEGGDGVLPLESRRLCITLVGPRRPASFYSSEADAETMDFYDLKGIVEVLCERLGFKAAEVELRVNPDTGTFGPRCADIWLQGKRIGRLGEVHPLVRREFDLPAVRINVAELEVEPLVLPQWRLDPLRPISSYPPVVEDLAFVVGEEVTNRQIETLLRTTGGELLADVELFDLYRGANLPEGSKSLAYRLTWQSNVSVLKDSDVAKLREKVIRRVERETGGKLRA
jgi:phenylalanyl-tRNA synthetase beta chain